MVNDTILFLSKEVNMDKKQIDNFEEMKRKANLDNVKESIKALAELSRALLDQVQIQQILIDKLKRENSKLKLELTKKVRGHVLS